MKTKVVFLISTIIIVFMIMFNMSISYASNSGDKISDVIDGADSFLSSADGTSIDEDKLKDTSNLIYKILMVLAISISVIVASILGIKFMIGSVEEKAQIKDQLVPFVVGCIVIFGAFTIWSITVRIGQQVSTTSGSGGYYEDDEDKGLSEYYDFCSECGKKVTTSEERHNKKCNACKNK